MIRKSICVQGGLKRPVAGQGIHVSAGINRGRGAGSPDGTLFAVGHKIDHADLGQSGLVVANNKRCVGIKIAMGRPGCVDDSIIEHESRPLFVLFRIKENVAAIAIGSASRIACRNIDRAS